MPVAAPAARSLKVFLTGDSGLILKSSDAVWSAKQRAWMPLPDLINWGADPVWPRLPNGLIWCGGGHDILRAFRARPVGPEEITVVVWMINDLIVNDMCVDEIPPWLWHVVDLLIRNLASMGAIGLRGRSCSLLAIAVGL